MLRSTSRHPSRESKCGDGAVEGVHTSRGFIKTKKVLSSVAGWTTHVQKMVNLRDAPCHSTPSSHGYRAPQAVA